MIAHLLLLGILTFPQVSMAIGHVESGLKTTAVGRAGERGAFQVMSRHWGRVPKTLRGQMLQHNRILCELNRECGGDLPRAIARYNGKGRKARRYLGRVTHEVLERELLGRE
jgi:hypothetical protein